MSFSPKLKFFETGVYPELDVMNVNKQYESMYYCGKDSSTQHWDLFIKNIEFKHLEIAFPLQLMLSLQNSKPQFSHCD